jgi:hypothetical protein
VQAKYGSDVTIIGVGGRAGDQSIIEFVDERGVSGFDHVIDEPNGEVWAAFGFSSQPAFAFLNDDGTMETHLGALGVSGMSERIETLIAN